MKEGHPQERSKSVSYYFDDSQDSQCCRRHRRRREKAKVHDGVCAMCLRERLCFILSSSSSLSSSSETAATDDDSAADFAVIVDPLAPTVAQHLELFDRFPACDMSPRKKQEQNPNGSRDDGHRHQRTIAALIQSDISFSRDQKRMGELGTPFLTKSKSTGWILLRNRRDSREEKKKQQQEEQKHEGYLLRSRTARNLDRSIRSTLKNYIHLLRWRSSGHH